MSYPKVPCRFTTITIQLDGSGPEDHRSVVACFAHQLPKDLRLVGGYDVLYGNVNTLFEKHPPGTFATLTASFTEYKSRP